MNTRLLRAWAAALGWDPDKHGPVDEASDRMLKIFIGVNRSRYEKRIYGMDHVGLFTFSKMVEANAEDFAVLAWLSVADVGDVFDQYHSERVTRIR